MLSKNLMRLPTEQELYDRLDLIPCHVSFEKKVDAQANKKSFIRGKVMYGDLEKDEKWNALSTFIDGTHMVGGMLDSSNPNRLRVSFNGDNNFAVEINRHEIGDKKVEITTSINDGTSAYFNKAINDYQADSVANATVIKQTFKVISNDLDAVLESAEIVHDGYNKVGAPIPTYADTNLLSNKLGRLYSTSSFVKNVVSKNLGWGWAGIARTACVIGADLLSGF